MSSELVTTTLKVLTSALNEVLRRERLAVVALDADQLLSIALEKDRLLEPLKAVSIGSQGDALRALFCQAEANRALLADAIDAITSVLGAGEAAPVYDARARLKAATPALAVRSA